MKLKVPRKPRNLQLHLTLVSKSKVSGAHKPKNKKREKCKLRKELKEEL